jgi:hypothetical protein
MALTNYDIPSSFTLTILAEGFYGFTRNPGESDAELRFRMKYHRLISLLKKLGVRI